jgi:hypothetical protein
MAERAKSASGQVSAKKKFAFDSTVEVSSCRDEVENATLDAYRSGALEVLAELWEENVEHLCGQRWQRRVKPKMTRAGWCACQLMLGGKRLDVRRPRVRSNKGKEVELPTIKAATQRDLLDRAAIEDVTAAVTTGTYPLERHPRDEIGVNFVEGLINRMSATQASYRGEFAAGLLIGAIEFPDQSFLGAVSITQDGSRSLVGLRAGSQRSSANVEGFLDDLVAKHRRSAPPAVFFVCEEPTIHEAIRARFGSAAILQRSPQDKRRRVLGLLPPSIQPSILEDLLEAYAQKSGRAAHKALQEVIKSLEGSYPEAASALADGLDDSLTMHRLGDSSGRTAATRAQPATHQGI